MFINLAVSDLQRSIQFFTELGFTFNPQFTDANATCMIIGEGCFAMLLVKPFFKGFIQKEICDTATHQEALIALTCKDRAEVDSLAETALRLGAQPAIPPTDHGFMYIRTFLDLDGHHWELFWMDPAGPPQS
jgi:predicted lactoylglutathione lyase